MFIAEKSDKSNLMKEGIHTFGSQFQGAAHGRKAVRPEAAVHTTCTVGKQGEVSTAAQLPFPFHSVPDSSPWKCARVNLPTSTYLIQKTPHGHSQGLVSMVILNAMK